MSYVVSIKREKSLITAAELEQAIQGIPGFVTDQGGVAWYAHPKSKATHFILDNGVILVTTPSSVALETMQLVAKALNATVIGEEGEDLTDVKVPASGPPLWGCAVIVFILGLVIWGLWWIFR